MLQPNWHSEISGISLCVVADFMGLTRPISLTLSTKHISSKKNSGMYRSDRLHTWMEYVSLDMLQRSHIGIVRPDWITTTPGLILSISTENYGVKICGVRLIYKDCNLEESSIAGSCMTSTSDSLCVLKRQENLLNCFRETGSDAITYTLQPGVKYIPEGDAAFDKLSWNEKHEHYRSGRSSMKVGMNILD